MLFNSYAFIFVFLPVVLVGFYTANALNRTAAILWLGIASLFFYGWWNWHFLPLLIASVLFNFGMGLVLLRESEGAGLAGWLSRRVALIFAISVDLAALGYFKYMNFFVDSLNAVLPHPFEMARIILPIGISFYTFTQIAFLVDSYQGQVREQSFVKYLLFVTYFPHLIAGPIIHHGEVMPQFQKSALRWASENLAVGLSIFAMGLFKKVVIADGVAFYAVPVFGALHSGSPPTFLEAWCGAFAYMFELYFDFSGYSDMAVGLSRSMGILLPINFDSPLRAQCIIEFWQRWHMTLTRWLTAYLYNPIAMWVMTRRMERGLGVSRHETRTPAGFATMVAFPMFCTMGLAGIWHGAGPQFAVFGLLHGFYLSINHAWRIFVKRPTARRRFTRQAAAVRNVALTYLAVLVGMVFFRADSVRDAMTLLGSMAGLHGIVIPQGYTAWLGPVAGFLQAGGVQFRAVMPLFTGASELGWLAFLLGVIWIVPNTQQIMQNYRPALNVTPRRIPAILAWRPNLMGAAAVVLLAVGSVLSLTRVSSFLYFQF